MGLMARFHARVAVALNVADGKGTPMDTAIGGDFRSFYKVNRVPAAPMQPVIDPAGWSAGELGAVATWSYRFTPRDIDELADAVTSVRRNDVPIEAVKQDNFPLTRLAEVMDDVRRELL